MSTIESKNLLVWVKAMSRGQSLPLDASEIHDSLAEAEVYAASAIAYAGQTIKAKLEDGKYHEYILQPSESGYVLEEAGSVSSADLKQYVLVVDTLPESGQEQGILYICGTTGSIWTGSAWKNVFWDVTTDIQSVSDKADEIKKGLDEKAPISNPVFSGTIKVDEDEVALKSYVESLFAQLKESTVPGVVDATSGIPTGYKAGQSYRVSEAGTYAGVVCETGDLILVVKDYVEDTASNADFLVIQANIDGAVTSKSDTTTIGEVVVFDSVTGKIIAGSGVQISSLNDAISKSHEHANRAHLDTYNKTQAELLSAAKGEAQDIVDGLGLDAKFEGKADKAATLAGYGITDAYTKTEEDTYRRTLEENINSKISATEVDEKIANTKNDILDEAAKNSSDVLEERIGGIPADTTIQSYIDTAVGSGGTASATAIATAKQEAIDASNAYTDEQITSALSIVEF